MRALALAAVLLAGCGRQPASPAPSRANYPPPLSKYNGRTAAEWGRDAQDRSPAVYMPAAEVLRELKAEGVPYLLAAAEAQREDMQATYEILVMLDGKLIHPADIRRLAPFLGEKYAKSDEWLINRVRGIALVVLRQAGPNARPLLPEIRSLQGNKHLGEQARQVIEVIGR